jgi:hypothetical protein
MRHNADKISIIFDKNKIVKKIKISYVEPVDVILDIENIQNNKENVYIFESGDKAKFLYERSCVNDLSFNYFQLYNKSVYRAFQEISKLLKIFCEEEEINLKKNLFCIASEYETEFLEDYWYDAGGFGIPNFCGYWFLETNNESYIKVNDIKEQISSGAVVMFQSGARTEFSGISKAISFNITTLSKLIGQYPQKWMPIFPS